jgi:hypothetical protein
MKLIKFASALVAGLALAGGVAKAQIPATFAFTAGYDDGSTATINNSVILSKVASYLNITLPSSAKLAFNTNGNLVIVDSANAIILDLTEGTNANDYLSTNITPGINGGMVTNITYVFRQVNSDGDGPLFFYDPIWTGNASLNNDLATSDLFNIKGKALATGSDGSFFLFFESETEIQRIDQNGAGSFQEFGFSEDEFEFCDGSKASIGVALNAGVYTLSFTINGSGTCFKRLFVENPSTGHVTSNIDADGNLHGTLSASGKQTGGSSFLDPYNGFGNYAEDFSTF